MPWKMHGTNAEDGDLIELVGLRHKHFIVRLKAGGEFQSHRGVIQHDAMIGQPFGSQINTHNGASFFMIQPSLSSLLRELKRNTQILYAKDIGYILVTMGVGPGTHVLEAGTGSGALTSAFAFAVGSEGRVTTYEARQEMQDLARRNLQSLGLDERVTFKLGNVADGFEERGIDALFLDLPNPFDYMEQVREALKPGGFFGCILPTTNQVEKLLVALRQTRFAFIDVCEVLLRYYKPEPSRFRPTDRMIAHTGFLIFARPVLVDETKADPALMREAGIVVAEAVSADEGSVEEESVDVPSADLAEDVDRFEEIVDAP